MRARLAERVFPEEEPEFQVAPMVDVLLVLLTFFMSITSTEILKTKSQIDILLPVAKEGKIGDKVSEVVLNIAWNPQTQQGYLEFEEKPLTDISLVTRIIQERKVNRPYFRAVLRADEQVPYSYVQQVMQACAVAGVDNITFNVMNKRSKTRASQP